MLARFIAALISSSLNLVNGRHRYDLILTLSTLCIVNQTWSSWFLVSKRSTKVKPVILYSMIDVESESESS